ncbi:MAG: rhomboid family intramembrane serine protease [Rhodospirillaceae bacterium]
MSAGTFSLPSTAIRLLMALVIVQGIRAILPPEFDAWFIYFLAFDPFRDGTFDPVWLYGALTSVFVHAGWMHLLANATWVVVLSPQIFPHLGGRRFVAFFAITGTAGALTHALVNWGESAFLVGASGAVFGLLGAGAYVLMRGRDGHSKPTLRDFGQYILVMMIVNLGYAMLSGGGVSWEAHAGGFFAGLAIFPFMRRPAPTPGGQTAFRVVGD